MKMKKSVLAAIVALAAVATSCRKDVHDVPANPSNPGETVAASTFNNLPETSAPQVKSVTSSAGNVSGYIAGLPARYDSTTKNYPLLLFVHGMGQLASTNAKLSAIQESGIAKLLQQHQFPASFTVNGESFSFITVAPQFTQWATAQDLNALIDQLVATYRVDQSRIYIAGFNMGGALAWDYAGAYSSKVAAIVPIAGPSWADEKRCQNIASNSVGVWAFHNSEDKVVSSSITTDIVKKVNSFNPASAARATIFSSGDHDAWSKAVDPSYKENGMNIYEWMLQFSKPAK